MKKAVTKKKRSFNCIHTICWIIIPMVIITLLVLDGLKLYMFNTERLIIIGACIFVVLIPFFKEITIKDFSLKKGNDAEYPKQRNNW